MTNGQLSAIGEKQTGKLESICVGALGLPLMTIAQIARRFTPGYWVRRTKRWFYGLLLVKALKKLLALLLLIYWGLAWVWEKVRPTPAYVAIGGADPRDGATYYQSQTHKSWRVAVLAENRTYWEKETGIEGNRCELCHTRNAEEWHADHIIPRSLSPEKATDLDNGQCLCDICNEGKSNAHSTDWRRFAMQDRRRAYGS